MASELLRGSEATGVQQRITLLASLATVRLRRGDPGADELLAEALELAVPTCELNRIGRVAAARAEQAWYAGRYAEVARETELGLRHVRGHTAPWIHGELLFWQSRVQPVGPIAERIAEPYRLMLAGEWRSAAGAWERLGMPYERALALAEGPEDALLEALAILDGLEAGPLASIVRQRLRKLGVRGVPRGPRAATRGNPAGLTAREVEVLRLLVSGHTNSELAKRMHVSSKTVEHHVSAILDKLDVHTRTEAVAAAFGLGIVKPDSSTSPAVSQEPR
ncbi:MAG: hypothetical protein E6K41_00470 [Gammaproteobacteria bacterium]|nr:MAG: hypothetical protein E6K41_00470 [Gammaproteobacteria bacterium]